MNQKTITKIISRLIVFVFVISIFQFSSLAQAATDSSMSTIWSNPNQGDNAYKFKVKDVVNSSLLTSVVGCTGVVNKVATWMARFMSSPTKMKQMAEAEKQKAVAQAKSTCAAIKAAAKTLAGSTPGPNNLPAGIDTALGKVKWCEENVDARNDEQIQIALDKQQSDAEINLRTQCFDGIAITLAKNQLTAMTRSAVNWVNTGYGGNPFFVQSMTNLTNNLERNVLETGKDILISDAFGSPYARDFATSTINSYQSGRGIGSSSSNFLNSLQSDLGAFITDPKSYYGNDKRTALQRAQDVNYAFSNDFSTGGWDGWLALTQRDQNNPLGFTMQASQYQADLLAKKVSDTRDELTQNSGFLSQKTCVKWQVYDQNGKPKKQINQNYDPQNDSINTNAYENVYTTTKPFVCYKIGGECCADDGWKVITPGSIIKDKTTNYLNSPERQLELAKTINDSLNALFSVLISKLEGGGLSGLSENVASTANWRDNTNDLSSIDGTSPYSNNGAYDGFNLTRDLGNTYIHETPILLGTWNATVCPPEPGDQSNCNIATNANKSYPLKADGSNKKIKLYPGSAPEVYQIKDGGATELENDTTNTKKPVDKPYGDVVNPTNGYYEVTTAGKSKLINEGYNGWAIGDRAFWDGSTWQNWKKGQTNPIEKRGVIQIQNDYIVAAKEILGVLPNVMPKLGELDYCLPGPNPSYKTNSTSAQSAYQDWVGSMYVGPVDADRTTFKIDQIGDPSVNNLQNIYNDNPSVWKIILGDSTKGEGGGGMQYLLNHFNGYHYGKNGKYSSSEKDDFSNHTYLMNLILNYVNSNLFQNFYDVFDKMMDQHYFKNMTSMYLDTETSIGETKNPSYMPMAESGLDLTKNINYYNDDITKVTQEYKDAIAQAKINIAKLEPIKAEVSQIIQAAQARRDANLLLQINKVSQTSGVTLTAAQYKAKYAECLSEEDIKVFDVDQITSGNNNTENCRNGIDDDLNGLVDAQDPACNSVLGNTQSQGNGSTDPVSLTAFCSEGTALSKAEATNLGLAFVGSCSGIKKTDCNNSYKFPGAYRCSWGEPPVDLNR
jgi:hypothetical protein